MGNSTKELFKDATLEDVAEFVRDPRNVHYIGMLMPPRPGVRLFSTRLEYEHYVPETVRNELFKIALINWEDIIWILVSIPKEDAPLAEKIAEECGLRFADGVPTIFASEGLTQFPVNEPNLFTLENIPGHRVYGQGQSRFLEIVEKETRQVDLIVAQWQSRN